jgi:chitin disaccharide deacetylase
MKLLPTLSLYLSLLLAATTSCAQKQTRLIIRGDDMGFSHSGNEALIKTFKEGIETSIEIIVPSPWFPEAVRLLKENPTVDVGIHIAFTSEWDNVKYRPVSNCPSLTDEDGYFYPMIWPNKNYPGKALTENNWKIEDIEKEFRAQIELALKKIPRISHISAHMGCYDMNPEVKALAKKLSKEYKIDIDPGEFGVKGVGYVGRKESSEEKIASFIKMLESLRPGETYMFVDHPGIDSPELRAIYHIGYENVASDRQGVTNTWTDQRVKDAIKRLGIQLISYAELGKR